MARLQLVTGPLGAALNRRGVKLTVRVSPPLNTMDWVQVRVFIACFLGLLLLVAATVTSLVVFQKCKTKKRKRKPRRGVTWHGSAPQPGQSLHMNRTDDITRQLYMVEEDRTDNTYSAMELGELEYSTNHANTAQRIVPATHSTVSASSSSEEEDADRTYYTITHSQSSTVTNGSQSDKAANGPDGVRSVHASVGVHLQGPPVPRRPSWTMQPGQSVSPPLYCVLGQQVDGEADFGHSEMRHGGPGINRKASRLSIGEINSTSLRQSLSDTGRKFSLLLARMSHNRPWGKSLDDEGITNLVSEVEDEDEVFY